MLHWQILLIMGFIFLIIEIFTPILFFLNFAIAFFAVAVLALFVTSWNILIPIAAVLALLNLIFLRPILVKGKNVESKKTGLDSKYIGQLAKVQEKVTQTGGFISIYDERWEARALHNEEISVGCEVKIVKNDSLILYVEKNKGEI